MNIKKSYMKNKAQYVTFFPQKEQKKNTFCCKAMHLKMTNFYSLHQSIKKWVFLNKPS